MVSSEIKNLLDVWDTGIVARATVHVRQDVPQDLQPDATIYVLDIDDGDEDDASSDRTLFETITYFKIVFFAATVDILQKYHKAIKKAIYGASIANGMYTLTKFKKENNTLNKRGEIEGFKSQLTEDDDI